MIAKLLGISQVIFLLPVEGTRVTEVRRTVWRADVDQIGRAVSLLVVVVLVKTKLCSQIQSRKDMESRIDVTKQFGTLSPAVLGNPYGSVTIEELLQVPLGNFTGKIAGISIIDLRGIWCPPLSSKTFSLVLFANKFIPTDSHFVGLAS